MLDKLYYCSFIATNLIGIGSLLNILNFFFFSTMLLRLRPFALVTACQTLLILQPGELFIYSCILGCAKKNKSFFEKHLLPVGSNCRYDRANKAKGTSFPSNRFCGSALSVGASCRSKDSRWEPNYLAREPTKLRMPGGRISKQLNDLLGGSICCTQPLEGDCAKG